MRPNGPRDPVAGPNTGPESPFPIKLSGPVIKGFGRGSRELGIPTANIPPSGLDQHHNLQSGVYFGFVGLKILPETTQPADNSNLTLSSEVDTRPDTEGHGNAGSDHGNNATNTPEIHSVLHGGAGRGSEDGVTTYPAVLSIGYNPFYKNETRSIPRARIHAISLTSPYTATHSFIPSIPSPCIFISRQNDSPIDSIKEIHILHHFPHFNFYHSPLNLLILGFIRPEYDYESLEALITDIKTDCDVARQSLARPAYREYQNDAWLRDFQWAVNVNVKTLEAEVVGDVNVNGTNGERGHGKDRKL